MISVFHCHWNLIAKSGCISYRSSKDECRESSTGFSECHFKSLFRALQVEGLEAGMYLLISLTSWNTTGGWILITLDFQRLLSLPHLSSYPIPPLIHPSPVWFQLSFFFTMFYILFYLFLPHGRRKMIWLALQTMFQKQIQDVWR